MSDSKSSAPSSSTHVAPVSPGRVFSGGFLMGLANLVPGVSGGTMILAIGLYERFIESVARVTSLRWDRPTLTFMVLLIGGAAVAALGLSAPAVWLVQEQRWIAYSLFIGMTLGGVPLLWQVMRPVSALSVKDVLAFGLSLALMIWLARGLSNTPVPQQFGVFIAVGALAASSMILPGISGSYILLIFGLYDVVVGSLRPRDLLDDPTGSLAILVPTGIGVLIGIGLLSNVLKVVLQRYERPAYAALLGLLLGSVVSLWPFQEAVHPELVGKQNVRAIVMLVEGAEDAAIEERTGIVWEPAHRAELARTHAGKSKGDLKLLGLELKRYGPSAGRIALSLGLLVGGFALTRLLGRKG